MQVKFPLHALRKTPDGSWQLVNLSEIITVPAVSPHGVRLQESPDNGEIEGSISIIGLTETSVYPPIKDTFYVNYRTGFIYFHSDQANQNINVNYWGKGSIVSVDVINTINANAQIASPTSATGAYSYFYQDVLYTDMTGMTYSYDDVGLLSSIVFETGREILYTYNTNAHVDTESLYDYDGITLIHTYQYIYDSTNRLIAKNYTPY